MLFRSFAQFETRFQLGWVAAGIVPVLIHLPGRFGFVLVGMVALAEALLYLASVRALGINRKPPHPLLALRSSISSQRRRRASPPQRQAKGAPIPPPPPGPRRSAGSQRAVDPRRPRGT